MFKQLTALSSVYVVDDDFNLFCSPSDYIAQMITNHKECIVITRKLNTFMYHDFAIFLIPCNETIPNAGFACSQLVSVIDQPGPPVKKWYNGHCSGFKSKALGLSCKDHCMDDEHHCKGVETVKPNQIKEYVHQCSDTTFILPQYVCDGKVDCPDGGDETKCNTICQFYNYPRYYIPRNCFTDCHKSNCTCTALYHQCDVGGCIPTSKICDGYKDCRDHSDESKMLCAIHLQDTIQLSDFDYDVRYGENELKYLDADGHKYLKTTEWPTLQAVMTCRKQNSNVLFSHQVCQFYVMGL